MAGTLATIDVERLLAILTLFRRTMDADGCFEDACRRAEITDGELEVALRVIGAVLPAKSAG